MCCPLFSNLLGILDLVSYTTYVMMSKIHFSILAWSYEILCNAFRGDPDENQGGARFFYLLTNYFFQRPHKNKLFFFMFIEQQTFFFIHAYYHTYIVSVMQCIVQSIHVIKTIHFWTHIQTNYFFLDTYTNKLFFWGHMQKQTIYFKKRPSPPLMFVWTAP